MSATPHLKPAPILPADSTGFAGDPRWPAVMVFLAAWWLPSTTARRTQHITLKKAYAIHVMAALFAVLLWVFATSWMRYHDFDLQREMGRLDYWLSRFSGRRSASTSMAVAGTVAGIEVAFVLLALLLGPWGAADEPVGASIRNALRNVWLHTVDALPWCVLLPVLLISVQQKANIDQGRWMSIQASNPPPTVPFARPGTPAGDEYQRQFSAWSRRAEAAWKNWQDQHAWYQNHATTVCAAIYIIAALHVLWLMLRAIGAPRHVPPISRPPACEQCGYNLSVTPADSRCPECGLLVSESLGPQARFGAPWEHRHELGRIRACRQTIVKALFRPSRLGRQLRASRRVADHRLFLLFPALVVFVGIDALLVAAFRSFTTSPAYLQRLLWEAGPLTATVFFGLALTLPFLAAGSVGLWLRWRTGRNLIPVAIQAACYLSWFLGMELIVSLALFLTASGMINRWMWRVISTPAWPGLMITVRFAWLGLNLALLATYGWLVHRVTIQARYANR